MDGEWQREECHSGLELAFLLARVPCETPLRLESAEARRDEMARALVLDMLEHTEERSYVRRVSVAQGTWQLIALTAMYVDFVAATFTELIGRRRGQGEPRTEWLPQLQIAQRGPDGALGRTTTLVHELGALLEQHGMAWLCAGCVNADAARTTGSRQQLGFECYYSNY